MVSTLHLKGRGMNFGDYFSRVITVFGVFFRYPNPLLLSVLARALENLQCY